MQPRNTIPPPTFPILQQLTLKPRALQSAQLELERKQHADSLRKGLEKRPDKETLIERTYTLIFSIFMYSNLYINAYDMNHYVGNILPDSTAAPAIQGQQRELAKHMRADSLEQKLQQRPKPEELLKEGILDEDPTSPKE